MSTPHTPGPWTAHQFNFGAGLMVVTNPPKTDSDKFMGHVIASQTTCPDWEANARLIAAAPDLLAALNMVFETGTLTPISPNTMKAVRAALLKAEG